MGIAVPLDNAEGATYKVSVTENRDLWNEDGQWNGPRDIRFFLRKTRFLAALWCAFLVAFAVLVSCDVADSRAVGVPVGIVAGTAVWFALVFGFSRGWIADGD